MVIMQTLESSTTTPHEKTLLRKDYTLTSRDLEYGLSLKISSFYDPAVKKFSNLAEEYVRSSDSHLRYFMFKDFEKYSDEELRIVVEKLTSFVRQYFYNNRTIGGEHSLNEMIEAHTGECKVVAASLQVLLQRMQPRIKSWYRSGNVIDSEGTFGHAWLEVQIGEKKYLADPALSPGELNEYDMAKKKRNYLELPFSVKVPRQYLRVK
jgi:hypothetical protein